MAQKFNKEIFGLLKRSPDTGDGWRYVSPTLTKLIQTEIEKTPSLFEQRKCCGVFQFRLSVEGQIVDKWL